MVSSISTQNVNSVQLFNALNSFKTTPTKPEQKTEVIQDEVGTKVKEDRWLKNIDVDEIKKYASSVGETSLSNEDIAYALKFGRSVLINYSA